MALPLEFYENFEAGTKGNFDSESDSGSRLDFPHARDLKPLVPWRGAYCCRINLGKNSTDAYLSETVSWASGQIRYGRFRLFVGNDVQFGNDGDRVRLLTFYSAGPTLEGTISLARVDPFGTVIVAAGPTATDYSDNGYLVAPQGQWLTVEFSKQVDTSAGVVLVSRPDIGQALAGLGAEGTITAVRLGAIDQTGDIQGTLLFDEFAIDEGRLYDDSGSAHNGALSGRSMHLLKSGFAFLGAGRIEHVNLIDGGSNDSVLRIYDTDEGQFTPIGALRETLKSNAASSSVQSFHRGFSVSRGAYVELSGTNPQALIRLGDVASEEESR